MLKNNSKNILISRFSALGDVAMTIPSVYNACYANPDRNFFFITRHHPSALFINKPGNLTIIGIDLNNYKGMRGLWNLASSLKIRYDINYFVDLHDVLRTKILRLFLLTKGVKSSHINKGRKKKAALTRRHNKVLLQLRTTPQRYDDTFSHAGIKLADKFTSVFEGGKGNPDDFKSVSSPKQPGEHWLAIAPFAKHKGKIYPLKLMEKVVAHFATKKNEKIFIFGHGEHERDAIQKWADKFPAVINMAEKDLGIPSELSLLSHCDVMLSMDSANMHFASLVGLRAVSVWGATHPYTGFLGRGQKESDTVQLEMVCRPCSVFGDKPCFRGDYHCLSGITPNIIIQKLQTPSDKL